MQLPEPCQIPRASVQAALQKEALTYLGLELVPSGS